MLIDNYQAMKNPAVRWELMRGCDSDLQLIARESDPQSQKVGPAKGVGFHDYDTF